MTPSPTKAAELIRRFQNNECTPEEIRLLKQWVAQLDLSDPSATGLSPEQLDTLKNQMYRHLMQTSPVVVYRRRISRRRYMAAAGWLVLVASSILLWYTFRKNGAPNQQAPLLTTILNNQNGVKKITLPDGTVVCLNRHSSLEFDAHHYNQQQRFVKLSGEGFFEVTSDPARPFIVETGNLHTRVLGTAFNIEAYQQESEIRVSLVHGKIALEDTGSSLSTVLSPDQTFRYSKAAGQGQVLPVEAQQVALWTQGYLVFNEVPLIEAIDRIQQRFNITVEYDAGLLRNKRITANFKSVSWAEALNNVLFVHGLQYRQTGNRVIVSRP